MSGESDNNDAPSTRRREVLRSIAGMAAVGIPSMSRSAAAQSSYPTVNLKDCTVFDWEDFNFKKIQPNNKENPAGNFSENLITAGAQTASLTDSRKEIFLELGTTFKVSGSQSSKSATFSFNGKYKGRLKALGSGVARFGMSSHLRKLPASPVGGSYIFAEEQRALDNDEFVEHELDDNFGGSLSVQLENNSTYVVRLMIHLEVFTSQAPGSAIADFGPQIGDQTSPPQGITLRHILLH